MSHSLSLHAFVFCWPGREAAAHHIAAALHGHVDHLTVLYKNDTGREEAGAGEWRRIPIERYYGWQFTESLRLNRGDIMLHVQADAGHDDWPRLAGRCREAFRVVPDLGVWSPNVYHSWYTPRRVRVGGSGGGGGGHTMIHAMGDALSEGRVAVLATDGVVWALSSALVGSLAELDYRANNFGWGLTEVAAAVAMTQGSTVVMDLDLKVAHPQGSGYNRAEALRQSQLFVAQLSPAQRAYCAILEQFTKLRDKQNLAKFLQPGYWRAKLRRPGWP